MPDPSDGPFCECGSCDATGRESGGPEIRLPVAAWAVAGSGDLHRLAVLPSHVANLTHDDLNLTVEHHDGWAAVG